MQADPKDSGRDGPELDRPRKVKVPENDSLTDMPEIDDGIVGLVNLLVKLLFSHQRLRFRVFLESHSVVVEDALQVLRRDLAGEISHSAEARLKVFIVRSPGGISLVVSPGVQKLAGGNGDSPADPFGQFALNHLRP